MPVLMITLMHILPTLMERRPNERSKKRKKEVCMYSSYVSMMDSLKDWDVTLRNLQWALISQKNDTSGISRERFYVSILRAVTNRFRIAYISWNIVLEI